LAAAVEGRLVVHDWPPPNLAKRWSRRAQLLGEPYGQARPDLLLPLFDPQLMRVDATGLYLMGTEIETPDRQGAGDRLTYFEHVQVWRCVPADGER
jgi:hypothetical protein